jgi:plasmid maintenance system antidote protein VapI
MSMIDLDEQLRQAVRKAGLSKYGLAKQAGIDRSMAVRFMNAERSLTLATASKIAALLGLELRPARRGQKGK